MSSLPAQIIAFSGDRSLGCGAPAEVAPKIKAAADKGSHAPILIFDAATSHAVEIDLRGTLADLQARLAIHAAASSGQAGIAEPRGPGRPKLGVVAREVTLLPRHWEWLSQQSGGASVALRKLVEEARRASTGRDRIREAQDIVHRFMTAMAGDYPQYEDALRSLYAGDRPRFETSVEKWPVDVRDHVKRLANGAFAAA